MQLALLEELSERAVLSSPNQVREYLRLTLEGRGYEVFMVLFLDTQNRLLAADEMFRGSLSQTSVYPREVVKAGLAHNAAGVILAHNHPSGVAESSRADECITQQLRQALALVDIKVLDHFIVGSGPGQVLSFAERGLLQPSGRSSHSHRILPLAEGASWWPPASVASNKPGRSLTAG